MEKGRGGWCGGRSSNLRVARKLMASVRRGGRRSSPGDRLGAQGAIAGLAESLDTADLSMSVAFTRRRRLIVHRP